MADSAQYPMQMEADAPHQPFVPTKNNGEPNVPPAPQAPQAPMGIAVDTPMPEATPLPPYIPTPVQQQPTQQLPPPPPPPPSVQAPRTATPNRTVNGTAEATTPMPAKAAAHGAPARRYLNEKVTGALLEGMKRLAAEQPEKPLQVLGEFLLQKSAEQENKPTA